MFLRAMIGVAVTLLLCPAAQTSPPGQPAQTAPRPITKAGLVNALRIGGLSQHEVAGHVLERGVNFRLTTADEVDLRAAGAGAEVLEAVRVSFRRPTSLRPPVAPAFTNPVPVSAELAAAVRQAAEPPAPARTAPEVNSLKRMRRLYIEKMAGGLDQYLRTEIVRRLSGRVEVVLGPMDADGIMTGVAEYRDGLSAAVTGRGLGLRDTASAGVTISDRSRTVVLWSDVAGDRSFLTGAVCKGGTRKVAERIVSKLKKAL